MELEGSLQPDESRSQLPTLKTHLIIILLSTPKSFERPLPFRLAN